MAFDISTAKPVDEKGGFDISTAKPVGEQPTTHQEQKNEPFMGSQFLGDVGSDLSKRFTKATDFTTEKMASNAPVARTQGSIYGLGQIAGGVSDIGLRTLESATPEFVKKGAKETVDFYKKLGTEQIKKLEEDNPSASAFVKNVVNKGTEFYDKVKKSNPEFVKGIEDALETSVNLAMVAPTAKAGQQFTGKVNQALASEPANLLRDIRVASKFKDDATVLAKTQELTRTNMERVGLKAPNPVDADNFYKKATTGILETIEKGGEKIAESPKPFEAWDRATRTTLKKIVNEYDTLAKQAGSAEISSAPLVTVLDKYLDKEGAYYKTLLTKHPDTLKEIELLKKHYTEGIKSFTAKQLQHDITDLNEELKGYYKNLQKGGGAMASIQADLATTEREMLSNAIDSLVIKDPKLAGRYQDLKNKYGSVVSTQKMIAQKAQKLAGQVDISYLDILSAAGVTHGILFGNPQLIVSALTVEGARQGVRMYKDPSRIIKNMFKDVEKLKNQKVIPTQSETVRNLTENLGLDTSIGSSPMAGVQSKQELNPFNAQGRKQALDMTLPLTGQRQAFLSGSQAKQQAINQRTPMYKGTVPKVPYEEQYPEMAERMKQRGF